MDFTAYITLCLILVAPSCHSTREGRAAKRTWTPVTEQKDCTYLALIQCGTDKWSSGTIISDSKVLTYSTCAETNIVVYAGFTTFDDVTKPPPADTQVRKVEKMDKYEEQEELKIFTLNEPWEFKDNVVGEVKLANGKSGRSPQACTVLGYEKAANKVTPHKLAQQIGDEGLCKADLGDKLYSKGSVVTELLKEEDWGGPAVTAEGKLLAINLKGETIGEAGKTQIFCNTYINVAKYRAWIEGVMTGKPGENEGSNNSTASSGYSIHSYQNKYSNWKVLGFLVPTIVTFLQY